MPRVRQPPARSVGGRDAGMRSVPPSLPDPRRDTRNAGRISDHPGRERPREQAGTAHMIKLCVLHGPNLNLLGIREPDIYGHDSFDEMNKKIKDRAKALDIEARIFQFNSEGEIIDAI